MADGVSVTVYLAQTLGAVYDSLGVPIYIEKMLRLVGKPLWTPLMIADSPITVRRFGSFPCQRIDHS